MLRRASRLDGGAVEGNDGLIGRIDDLLVGEPSWRVRWLVIAGDAGLDVPRLLLPPQALTGGTSEAGPFAVDLTQRQVRDSPAADAAPSARHRSAPSRDDGETILHPGPASPVEADLGFILGQLSRGSPYSTGFLFPPQPDADAVETGVLRFTAPMPATAHLRSAGEIAGYDVVAGDGSVGTVEDLLIDAEDWAIRYLVVVAGPALEGRRLLLSPRWISRVEWGQKRIETGLSRDALRRSPTYDPALPLAPSDEMQLHAHYGRWGYWR